MGRWLVGAAYFAGLPHSVLLACALFGVLLVLAVFYSATRTRLFSSAASDDRIWPLLLLLTQVTLVAIFLREVRGGLIFSDDHPSFLYRFHLLSRGFPYMPIYNADWNAGQVSREIFSSGAQLLWFLAFPFAQIIGSFEDTHSAARYTLLIPYLFILLVPWSVYFAARIAAQPRNTAAIAALFALLPTTMLSEWVLGFGTIAFSAAIGLVPIVLALAVKVSFYPSETATMHRAALVVTLWICLCWPLSFVCFIPFAILLLPRLPALRRQQQLWCVLWPFLLVALLHLQSIATLLHGGKVSSLLARDSLPGSHAHQDSDHSSENRALPTKWRMMQRINPVLLLFGIPGLLALSDKRFRNALAFTSVWLAGISIAGLYFKPQLELPRMIIPAAFVLCLPAALGIRSLFLFTATKLSDSKRHPLQRLAAGTALFATITATLTGPAAAATAYGNRSSYRFVTAPPMLAELAAAVRQYGGNGRTFIAGFILHDLGATDYRSQDGGHVAPLPALSGKPFYASHYYHVYWNTVDPIPHSYRKRRQQGIEEFLDLINATAVISFRREWATYFREHPGYKQVFQGGRFRLFVREPAATGYFVEGSGEVTQTAHGIRVVPHSTEMVLKFRYHSLLEAVGAPGISIEPSFVFDEGVGSKETAPVSFIRLRVPPEAVAAKLPIDITARWPAL